MALVLQPVVEAHTGILSDFFAREKAVRAYSIIEVHHNHIPFRIFDEFSPVVVRIPVDIEATTLNEDVNRKVAGIRGLGRSEDIDEQAIL